MKSEDEKLSRVRDAVYKLPQLDGHSTPVASNLLEWFERLMGIACSSAGMGTRRREVGILLAVMRETFEKKSDTERETEPADAPPG